LNDLIFHDNSLLFGETVRPPHRTARRNLHLAVFWFEGWFLGWPNRLENVVGTRFAGGDSAA
jgi:hypothetical protein